MCFKILVTEQLLITVWRLTSVVPGHRRGKPEYGECQASLGYLIMLYLKPTQTKQISHNYLPGKGWDYSNLEFWRRIQTCQVLRLQTGQLWQAYIYIYI